MKANLPGNPHAFAATERLIEMSLPELKTIDLGLIADAITQSNLAIAYEIRTQTLLQAHTHNAAMAGNFYGVSLEGAPKLLARNLKRNENEIAERLGK